MSARPAASASSSSFTKSPLPPTFASEVSRRRSPSVVMPRIRTSTPGYNAASFDSTCRACHIASADSREAITMRRGAFFPEVVSDMLLAKMIRRALLTAIQALIAAPAAAQDRLAYADDLAAIAADAAARRVPLMIVFTEASCPWCTRAKRDYLVPLQARGPLASKVIVRVVDVSTDRSLRGFGGEETTHREFGRF